MADITKCEGTDCPLKESCFRFKSKANEYWQAYFTKVPFNEESDSCEHYWEVSEDILDKMNKMWYT